MAGLADMAVRVLPGVLADPRRVRPDPIVRDAACLRGAVAAWELGVPAASSFTPFAFNRRAGSTVDPVTRTVLVDADQTVELSALDFDLLFAMAQVPGRVFTRRFGRPPGGCSLRTAGGAVVRIARRLGRDCGSVPPATGGPFLCADPTACATGRPHIADTGTSHIGFRCVARPH